MVHTGEPVAYESLPADADLINAVRVGNFPVAERMARQRLDRNPQDSGAWAMLGLSLRGLGQVDQVVPCFEKAAEGGLDGGWFWSSFGTVLREVGRLDDARQAYLRATKIEPDDPEFWVDLGYLYMEIGFIAKARDALLRALALNPDMPEVRVHAARMCMESGEDADAGEILEGWRQWADRIDNELKVDLGSELIRLGQGGDGQAMLRSLRSDPACGSLAIIRLAAAQERMNDVDEARRTAALLPPSNTGDDDNVRRERAMLDATLLDRAGAADEARRCLESVVDLTGPRSIRVAALFQLAKACDKVGDANACLGFLARAHADQLDVARQLVPELLRPDSVPLGIVDTRISAQQYAHWTPVGGPPASASPVFVVGFPRSGTTMLEQMLDAHPGLRSMDEQTFVQRVIERMGRFGLRYPTDLGLLDAAQCDILRETYWSCVAKLVDLQPGQRLVDKNPLTMLRLPLLRRVFPNSRIIFVVRHPCDVLLSCYMQHFSEPAFTVLCSTIGRLAQGYIRATQFWWNQVEVLDAPVHEWRYESALEDFDGEVRRLADYLGLDDASPLHDFSAHARAKGYISTPSYTQVVKPLYKSSRGRWHRYHNFFEPVLPVLEPALKHWNYDG